MALDNIASGVGQVAADAVVMAVVAAAVALYCVALTLALLHTARTMVDHHRSSLLLLDLLLLLLPVSFSMLPAFAAFSSIFHEIASQKRRKEVTRFIGKKKNKLAYSGAPLGICIIFVCFIGMSRLRGIYT